MNAPLRQADRIGRLSTILGENALVLLRFDGADHLNELFEYRVEALSTDRDIDFDALMGTHATVTLDAKQARHFDGIVTQTRWIGAGENGHRYDLTLRPWFWLAGRRRNQRIFHNKTVVQIVKELLADYSDLGDPALELALTGEYPKLEYTVQYRESDLDFARRQLERHGISFYFTHTEGSHTLVLSDDVGSHPSVGERRFFAYDGHHMAEEEHFWEWAPERNLTTGAVRLMDYNFKTPMAAMEVDRQGDAAYARGKIESFDYPGDYLERGRGKTVVGLRTDGERGGDRRFRAAGDCLSLGAGMRVSLGGETVPGTGETFVVLSASYHFISEAYGSGAPVRDGYAFTGAWTVMPVAAPMMAPHRTAVPVVQGPQTAMVVGDGEIDCDEYGRILVRFHWDLANAYSMRCRVSQNWAGGGWGGMIIPRIGMEVIVEFLEGDPDKPLVIGNVFNGKNRAPYELPANKTRAVWRSQTHQGSGFNEISFEDQSGTQEIYMHAQKDHRVKILNDQNQEIDHDRTKTVGHDQVEKIVNDKTITVGNDHTETIIANKKLTVKGTHTEDITGAMSLTVTGARNETIKSERKLTVTGDNTTTVETGNDALIVNTGNHTTTVKTGSRNIAVLEAGQYTTVKDDIVTVSESGGIAIKAATSVIIEAPMILLKSDANNFIQIGGGQLIIEGAETYINPRETAPDTSPASPPGGGGGSMPPTV